MTGGRKLGGAATSAGALGTAYEDSMARCWHRFWSGAVVILLGMAQFAVLLLAGVWLTGSPPGPAEHLERLLDRILPLLPLPMVSRVLAVGITYVPLPLAVCLLVYVRLMGRGKHADEPRETLCRQCGYILRGISEPRCPECGEAI
jgi:sulfite exporter TauE/SafE